MREPAKGFSRELQVGLFVFAACLVIAAFSFRITDSPLLRRGTTFVTYIDDATGIFKNSKVKMSGIDIGVIRKIELENGRAKITLLIDKGVEVPQNSLIAPRPLGILGDKYLDVVLPGHGGNKLLPDANTGSATPVPAESKPDSALDLRRHIPTSLWELVGVSSAHAEVIASAQAQSQQTDSKGNKVLTAVQSPATLDDLTRQLGKVAEDLKAISGSIRNMVEGEGNINSPVGRTLRNAESLTRNMNDLVAENRKDVRSTVRSLNSLSKKLEDTVNSFDQKKMSEDLKRLADAAGNVSKTIANMQEISEKLNKGQGTLGRLINDDSIAVEFERTLRTVNQALDRAQRTLTVVEVRSEYLDKSSDFKSYIGLSIYPREDTGYLGYVVIDPTGTVSTKITTTTVNGGTPTVTEKMVNDKDALKFSLQYFKRFWKLALRIGLFESSGGVGTDFFLLGDRVRLSAEIFDFSRTGQRGNLKAYVDVKFLSYFHLLGGGNELIAKNTPGSPIQKGYFAGIGIKFSDDDLKTILLLPSVN